ncbi:MAG: hypothetical protein Q8K55_08925 [Gemmatimonadaceae bacterium]|nr:hypothetical protein [Gemmatimonadaceae bacterium]
MFRAVLYTQWKWTRPAIVLAVLVAGYIPVAALRAMPYKSEDSYYIPALYRDITAASTYYQWLALFVAVIVAISAWQADGHRQHVYALALPVPRWRFVLLRFSAGAALLSVVAAAVGLFGGVAAAIAPLPPMLHAYPVGLGVRFWLGSLIPFGLIFALLVSNPKRVRLVVAGVATIIVVDMALSAMGLIEKPVVFGTIFDAIYSGRGPLAAFLSKWMLVDV